MQGSFGAMMTASTGNRTMVMNNANSSGMSIKHQIGFKLKQPSHEKGGFKAGGPIRATGAAIEKMDNLIQTSGNTFSNTQSSFKQQSYTPSNLSSSKMPQRPGSSKPIQKGQLLETNSEKQKPKKTFGKFSFTFISLTPFSFLKCQG